jgi:hypothetical protein
MDDGQYPKTIILIIYHRQKLLDQVSSSWSTRTHGGTRRYLTSIKTKHGNLEPSLILAHTEIRPRNEVQAYQKQAQSFH